MDYKQLMILQNINFYEEQGAKQYCFFLFVNNGSGSNVGSSLLKQQVQKIQFRLPSDPEGDSTLRCSLYIYNLRKNRKQGFLKVKQQSQSTNKKCYIIVCGGDGTVMWVVTQMVKYDIKVLSVPLGVIPLGTGNDFSRELGWGFQISELVDNSFKKIKKLMRQWIAAKQQYFDIWDIEAEIFEDGKFQKVENIRNSLIQGATIKRTFCNYFSFGIDGKIGYSFDMHRTKTRFGNLAMYACLGMVKTMTKTQSLDQLLDCIEIENHKKVQRTSSLKEQSHISESLSRSLIIKGSNSSASFKRQDKFSETQDMFEKDYYNILALNINSYTGGVKNIWENAKDGFLKKYRHQQYSDVSTGDGKLQIVSFGSSFGIAMERTLGGFSKKVAQGTGPFIFRFQRYEKKPKHRTYLQIDGQFIRFTNPKTIRISHSTLVPYGKIKVIRNIKQKL